MLEAIAQCVLLLDVIVASSVADLGHADYRRRECASQVLPEWTELALAHVEVAVSSSDLEVARRAGVIRDEIRRVRAERMAASVLPTDYPHLPWIDMLPSDLPDRQTVLMHYLDMVKTASSPALTPQWPEYRRATYFFVRDQLTAGKSEREIVELLDRMVDSERQWFRYGGHRLTKATDH